MPSHLPYRSIFLLSEERFPALYSPEAIAEVQRLTRNDGRVYNREALLRTPEDFADVRLVFSGWGAPTMDEELLAALPSLEALFYGAGSVRALTTEAFWGRNILLTSAYQVNAVPVAQYTVSAVVFALKQAFHLSRRLGTGMCVPMHDKDAIPGVYRGSRVGIVSLGAIGRLVCRMLAGYEVDVLAYDPYAEESVFSELSVERVDRLDELFMRCEVISLHAPWLKETEGMVTGKLLRLMPPGATFINTSRGAVVNERELLEVLQERPDLFAVLDVLIDETVFHAHPLARLPNVFMTPHIAGSKGRESHRMGMTAVEECRRYLCGLPQLCALNQATTQSLA